jgi:hypothetical protein
MWLIDSLQLNERRGDMPILLWLVGIPIPLIIILILLLR